MASPERTQPPRRASPSTAGSRQQFTQLSPLLIQQVDQLLKLKPLHSSKTTTTSPSPPPHPRPRIISSRPWPSNLSAPTIRSPYFDPLPAHRAPDSDGSYDSIGRKYLVALIGGDGVNGAAEGERGSIENEPVIARVMEIYILHVCQHFNAVHGRHLPGMMPLCVAQDTLFWMYFERFEVRGIEADEGVRAFRNGYVPAVQRLREEGVTAEVFKQLQHFFIPVEFRECHAQLLVISPVTRTIQFFDSGVRDFGCRPVQIAMACILIDMLVESSLGGGENWFVPSQWKVRRDMGSVQRRPDKNCVLHCLTNAQSVAFGYDISSRCRNFANRRYRVAAELLNGGFEPHDGDVNSEFFYPVNAELLVAGSAEWHSYRDDKALRPLLEEHETLRMLDEYDSSIRGRSATGGK